MANEKNVFILLDERDLAEYSGDQLEEYLSMLSEDSIYIRTEDNKGIIMNEDGQSFIVQEHY